MDSQYSLLQMKALCTGIEMKTINIENLNPELVISKAIIGVFSKKFPFKDVSKIKILESSLKIEIPGTKYLLLIKDEFSKINTFVNLVNPETFIIFESVEDFMDVSGLEGSEKKIKMGC